MLLSWRVLPWKDLTPEILYRILELLADVFVVEQNCAHLDPHGKNGSALHISLFEENKLNGYARVFFNENLRIVDQLVVHPH